jgi:hypothetical protein
MGKPNNRQPRKESPTSQTNNQGTNKTMKKNKYVALAVAIIFIFSVIATQIPLSYAAATRIYLPSTGASAVNPAYSGDWEKTSQAGARRRCIVGGKSVSAMASITMTETSLTANYDMLAQQWVSDPIAAQTIMGTVRGQLRASEANIAADADIAIIIYVVNSTGTGVRGTLLSYFPAVITNEFALTTLTNRMFPASTAVNSVTAQDGDRLVIEVGTRMFNTINTAYNILINFGDNAATDLAVDNTTTTANTPWIEFSQGIIFYQTNDYNGGWTAGNATGWAAGNSTGWTNGNATGYTNGWNDGNNTGWIAGNSTGYTNGWNAGNATGWIDGNNTGYSVGWTAGNSTGWVAGNSSGWIAGNATGWVSGNTTGYANGWTAGNSSGYTTGWVDGNATGWLTGNSTGYTLGWTNGNNTGWVTGNATGYIAGNLTGWLNGNATGYANGYAAGLLASGGSGGGGGTSGLGTLNIRITDWQNNPKKNTTVTLYDYQYKQSENYTTDQNGTITARLRYTTYELHAGLINQTIPFYALQTPKETQTYQETALMILLSSLGTQYWVLPLWAWIIIAIAIIILLYWLTG